MMRGWRIGMTRSDKFITLFIIMVFCLITYFTLEDYGVTWDEGFGYFPAAKSYYKWFRKPRYNTIEKYWGVNNEQPPLNKIIAGFSWYIFHDKLGMTNIKSFRISIILIIFLFLFYLFRFVNELYGRWVAVFVVTAFFTLPRIFYHMHVVALDYTISAIWFFTIYAYIKGFNSYRMIIISSVLMGIGFAAKLNAFFIYIPLLFYWLLYYGKDLPNLRLFRNWQRFISSVSKLIPFLFIPFLVFFILWPWLWQKTFQMIYEYLHFHSSHGYIPTYYFGKTYKNAPWHYPLVMTILTIPVIVLIPMFVGIVRSFFEPHRRIKLFLLFNAVFPILLISIPSIPKYDGIRLWMPAFSFLCIFCGIGLKYLIEKVRWKRFFVTVYLLLFGISAYNGLIRYHPYQVVYYNELIGGVSGAYKIGMETDYWGSAFKGTLNWINENMKGKDIYVYENPYPFYWYYEDGLLSNDVRLSEYSNSEYMILSVRRGIFDSEMWEYFNEMDPVYSLRLFNTPLVNIYKVEHER